MTFPNSYVEQMRNDDIIWIRCDRGDVAIRCFLSLDVWYCVFNAMHTVFVCSIRGYGR